MFVPRFRKLEAAPRLSILTEIRTRGKFLIRFRAVVVSCIQYLWLRLEMLIFQWNAHTSGLHQSRQVAAVYSIICATFFSHQDCADAGEQLHAPLKQGLPGSNAF